MTGEAIKPGTPLPWVLIGHSEGAQFPSHIQGHYGPSESGVEQIQTIAFLSGFQRAAGIAEANAAYIVHACNEYPALKAKADALAEAVELAETHITTMLTAIASGNAEAGRNFANADPVVSQLRQALAAYRESGQ
jgi:hypothetical protein